MLFGFYTPADIEIGRRIYESGVQPLGMVETLQLAAYQMKHAAEVAARMWNTVYRREEMGSLIKAETKTKLVTLDRTLKDAQAEIATAKSEGNELVAMATMAAAMQQLRSMFDGQVLSLCKPLMNTKLGFLTDRDPAKGWTGQAYDDDVVRDVLLAGALQGARYTGNEINIIAGGLYLTREFYERVFHELPGVTDAEPPALGIPRATELGGKTYATVNGKLRFKLDGKQIELDFSGERAVVVVWNKGMGVDAVHGKAKKRIYAYAYRYVSGISFDETDPADTIDGQVVGEAEQELQEDAPPAPESTQTAEADQSVDLEADAAKQLKRVRRPTR